MKNCVRSKVTDTTKITEANRKRSRITLEMCNNIVKDRENGLTYTQLVNKYNIGRGVCQSIVAGNHWTQREARENGHT